ncbi:MAG: hypothetical protein ACFFC7_00050 [Candidatus Hermodarchaeota archaeon]
MSEERIKEILADVELCTKTANALSAKLKKLHLSLQEMLAELPEGELERVKIASEKTEELKLREPAAKAATPAHTILNNTVSDIIINFARKVKNEVLSGTEIADQLNDLRDKLTEKYGFHPSLREMTRESSRVGKITDELKPEEKNDLLKKLEDWRLRLTQ